MQIPKGDYGTTITFYCKAKNASGVWEARDLTGMTATLKVWVEGVPGTLLLNKEMTITDAENGEVTYTPQAGDFGTAGLFKAEIECTATGVKDSSYSFDLEVVESP